MNANEFINFLMEDLVYDRILEESVETHLDEIFKKDDKYEINCPVIKVEEDDKCLICLEDIKKEEDVYSLPCRHFFHINCLKQSVSHNHLYCPTCREKIPIRNKNEHFIQYH